MTMTKTILLVDDDNQFRSFMAEMLSDNNYNAIEAENGETGLEKYFADKPDLVITDIVMPEKEGIELILTVRQDNESVPIIAISGGNLGNADSYLGMAQKLGVNATLTKPFAMDDILKEINTLLAD